MGYWPVQFSSDKVFVQSIFQISTWKVFFIKNIFIMKYLTDFRKTLETGLGPRLRRVTIFLFDETIALFYQ